MYSFKKKYPIRSQAILLICFFSCIAMSFSFISFTQENNAPVVRIISPSDRSKIQWNTDIQYTIQVSDKEDGNSQYDELSNTEVLMHIRYIPDTTKFANYGNSKIADEEPRAITLMKTSTCFGCHTSRGKLIGPSFERIADRYSYSETTVSALTQKIIQGSTGIWGDVKMPSHKDMKPEEVNEVVTWILKDNKDPNDFYQAGLKGLVRSKEKSDKDTDKGVYVLTASYIDHGVAGNLQQKKRGHHSIILKPY